MTTILEESLGKCEMLILCVLPLLFVATSGLLQLVSQVSSGKSENDGVEMI
jgi:hypothetical protein